MTWDEELEVVRRQRYITDKEKIEISKFGKVKQEEIVETILKKQKEAGTKARMDQLRDE
jgi:hypothetical protein